VRRRLRKLIGRSPAANPLERYFLANEGRRIHKWMHYFDVYHRHFERFRGRPVTVVEFGVSQGGSLQMWRSYFGPRSQIIGVDIDPRCKAFEEPGIRVRIGDQEDRDFLQALVSEVGPIDVVIDDGGHTMAQQIATFEVLYPALRPDGVFLVEDVHTSYWAHYAGGLQRPGTFIEYAKRLIDQLNAWHSREPAFVVDDFTRTTRSMHFYDSIVVFERGIVRAPRHKATGSRTFGDPSE
jgi:cephalosporin hydroxylase